MICETKKAMKEKARREYHAAWSRDRHRGRRGVSGSLRDGKVYLWDCGFVTAFNRDGEQILEIQGQYEDVRKTILTRLYKSTVFVRCGDWHRIPHCSISRDEFRAIDAALKAREEGE